MQNSVLPEKHLQGLEWYAGAFLSWRMFYATVITSYWTFFLILLQCLGLVTTHECFLASDLLENLIWSGKKHVLTIEHGVINYILP